MELPVIKVSADSTSKEITPIAMAIHHMVAGLPVTMRTLNKKGVRIEMGKIVNSNYSGPILEMALETNSTIKTVPKSGAYKGIPVVVSTVNDDNGNAVAAIGIVNVTQGLKFRY
jgi:hypothetical protein